jgi:hypothetical protein
MFSFRTRFCPVLLGLFFFLRGGLVADVFTVVNADSSGPGSLAQATSDANAVQGPHQIVFAIPGPGVHRIDLSQAGIALGSSTTIDGYTQPGASPNTLSVGNNAVILIQLDGGGPFFAQSGGLRMFGNNSVVRGLSFSGFSGPTAVNQAIIVGNAVEGGNQNRIEGNFIGLEPDGITLNGNDYGIYFQSGNENVIGGNTPAARNIISGNRTGIFGPFNATIIGNYFGTDASGLRQGYGNNTAIVSYANNIIGTGEPGAGNVITGSDLGIRAFGDNAAIRGNLIGPRPDGGPSFGNVIGIRIEGSTTLGGLAPGEGNVIAFNDTGVQVYGDTSSLSNLAYGNSYIDIDLGGDGRTSNDFGDQDAGPNNLQNFPVIVSVARNPGETVVSGGLNSTASTAFTLQFFATGPDSTPGQRLLGTRTLTTNSAGDASFQFAFPISTAPDEFITATATGPNGNTSEFFPPNGVVELANISTRGNVGAGDNILIGGFILNFGSQRSFLVRALGPSLSVNGALVDPRIEVRAANGAFIAGNDNWRDFQEQAISATGLAPTNDLEAALIVFPNTGQNYTVLLGGVNGGTGIATVEVYALGGNPSGFSKKFRNISTRGNVGTGADVLIGGTIVQGSAPQRMLLRAIGPDLAAAGVSGALPDPTLELRDAEGALVASNDDWRSNQEQEIVATGLAPQDNRNAAILTTVLPTSYTAIVQGKNGATGIALVEIYQLD